MDILPISFWGGWTAGIFLLGLLGLAWLSVGIYRARDVESPQETWDGNLREGNSTPPKWWFFSLFATLIFSAVYVMLYPGFGDNRGMLQWNQHSQLADGLEYYRQRTAATKQRWQTAPMEALRQDESAMRSARRLFTVHCTACHGDDAGGQAGLFPSLADDEWSWGGDEAQLLHTLKSGRIAAMPGWQAAFSDAQIQALTDYVLALNDGSADDSHAGRIPYVASCAACHGMMGEGNVALGAPRFVNHRWQYTDNGDVRSGVEKTIRHGRNGIMPAQQGRLSEAQIRLLAAWLGGGQATAPPGL